MTVKQLIGKPQQEDLIAPSFVKETPGETDTRHWRIIGLERIAPDPEGW